MQSISRISLSKAGTELYGATFFVKFTLEIIIIHGDPQV